MQIAKGPAILHLTNSRLISLFLKDCLHLRHVIIGNLYSTNYNVLRTIDQNERHDFFKMQLSGVESGMQRKSRRFII